MLNVDYIDNFETRAIDAIRDLAADAERGDIAVAFLSYRGWLELRPSLTAMVGRGGRLRVIVRRDTRHTTFRAAQKAIEQKVGLWDWADDVEFLGLSWVEFV